MRIDVGKQNVSDRAFVLDASALLALLLLEPGAESVGAMLPQATISSVNLSEVVAKLAERGMPEQAIRAAIDPLSLEVTDFTVDAAFHAGLLRPSTRRLGLSLGDRACLALAMQRGAPAVTTDKRWSELKLGLAVQVIR